MILGTVCFQDWSSRLTPFRLLSFRIQGTQNDNLKLLTSSGKTIYEISYISLK